MQLNAGDVEVKVVNDLKLEEGIYMDEYADVGVRRRRKLNSRKRMAGRGDESDLAPNNETAGAGTHQNGVSEDEVVRQVHKRRDMGWSDGSTLSPEIMDIQMEMKMEPGLVPEHVARQHHEAQRLRSSHYGQHKGV